MRIRLGGTVLNIRWPHRFNTLSYVIFALTILVVLVLVTKQKVVLQESDTVINNEEDVFDDQREKNEAEFIGKPVLNTLPKKSRYEHLNEPRIYGRDGVRVKNVVPDPNGNENVRVRTRMAMDLVRDRQAAIDKVGREYIRYQNRPADQTYNINVTFSDNLSLDRSLPDTRPPVCQKVDYKLSSNLTATVVIPFYNEALSMLLRTVHSVLNRTPLNLLDEIILVDDKSTHQYLHSQLDDYVNLFPRVRLLRNDIRRGLVVSRMQGYRASKSSVVIFLDAHAEVNEGWLPPLLDELERHPHSVIQPFVDGIDAMTLQYTQPSIIHKGSFSWDLR